MYISHAHRVGKRLGGHREPNGESKTKKGSPRSYKNSNETAEGMLVEGIFGENPEVMMWESVPLLVSYYCDISEGKDLFALLQNIVVKRSCVRRIVNLEDNISGQMGDERFLKDATTIKRKCMAAPNERSLKFLVENNRDLESKADGSPDYWRPTNYCSGWPS